jgi:enterochelin esterase-like enzyme
MSPLRARLGGRVKALAAIALGFVAGAVTGCAGREHRLSYVAYQSPRMAREVGYSVYLPPGWTAREQLPLVLFLHGAGDDPTAFDRAGLGSMLDNAKAPRAVIALPKGDRGFWENWYNGEQPYREWVMRELLPSLQKQFNTAPCPEGCHVMGVSMGGYGALMFALREPGTFASVTAISAPIYTPESVKAFYETTLWRMLLPIESIWGPFDEKAVASRNLYQHWRKPEDLHGSQLLLAWGDQEDDDMVLNNQRFDQHLLKQGISHKKIVYHGAHDWEAWSPVIVQALTQQLSVHTPPVPIQLAPPTAPPAPLTPSPPLLTAPPAQRTPPPPPLTPEQQSHL